MAARIRSCPWKQSGSDAVVAFCGRAGRNIRAAIGGQIDTMIIAQQRGDFHEDLFVLRLPGSGRGRFAPLRSACLVSWSYAARGSDEGTAEAGPRGLLRKLAALGALVCCAPGDVCAAEVPDDARIASLLRTHCAMCHARTPPHAMVNDAVPPKPVVLETRGDLRVFARRVHDFTVASTFTPLGNETGMTEADRVAPGAWIEAQR